MSNYVWKWFLDQNGYTAVNLVDYQLGENKKLDYVQKFLSPCVHEAKCGWDHVDYWVMNGPNGRDEFAVLYPEESNTGGRWICVSGDSLGAIAEAVWNCVYN